MLAYFRKGFSVCFLKMTLRFIKIISVCFYGGSEYLQISYRLFVNVLPLKFQLSGGKGWDSIYRFTPQHVCVCSKPEPGIPTLYMYVVVICCIQWVIMMRGDCSFCWYLWNYRPSLFKLPFHIYRQL